LTFEVFTHVKDQLVGACRQLVALQQWPIAATVGIGADCLEQGMAASRQVEAPELDAQILRRAALCRIKDVRGEAALHGRLAPFYSAYALRLSVSRIRP